MKRGGKNKKPTDGDEEVGGGGNGWEMGIWRRVGDGAGRQGLGK